MAWMAETFARRADPKALWPEARSVIMLAVNYGPAERSARGARGAQTAARSRSMPAIATITTSIKGRLKTLAGWLVAAARPEQRDVKVFVDTAPVMEKPLAAAAGLGWQGKHTNLVSREFGSWLFLGSIFTDLDARARRAGARPLRRLPRLPRRLPDAGVSRALPARCAALHLLPDDRAQGGDRAANCGAAIGNRIYGCDDCLAVCPWNKFARERARGQARRAATASPIRRSPNSPRSTTRAFARRFAGGPIKRIGHARFLRNVMIAIGNSGDARA